MNIIVYGSKKALGKRHNLSLRKVNRCMVEGSVLRATHHSGKPMGYIYLLEYTQDGGKDIKKET